MKGYSIDNMKCRWKVTSLLKKEEDWGLTVFFSFILCIYYTDKNHFVYKQNVRLINAFAFPWDILRTCNGHDFSREMTKIHCRCIYKDMPKHISSCAFSTFAKV